MSDRALVTGFVPSGGRGRNPAGEIATALHGRTILGMPVIGRTLPVSYSEIGRSVEALLDELRPRIVISLGLWPGEPVDAYRARRPQRRRFRDRRTISARWRPTSQCIGNGAAAKLATLPVRTIEGRSSTPEIPARISNTAGTFLCNACLYSFLAAAETMRRARGLREAHSHVPYLPSQVAGPASARTREEAVLEFHQRADTGLDGSRHRIRASRSRSWSTLPETAAVDADPLRWPSVILELECSASGSAQR